MSEEAMPAQRDSLRESFRELFSVENPHDFQIDVAAHLLNGKSVILQAPTGSGKTRAALFPFLNGWRHDPAAFPQQCLYAVPMRVLANQFEAEFQQTVTHYAQAHSLGNARHVRVQTGARPDDPKFESDLVFTTIDQVLSSYLTIPFSLTNRQANLNGGAIVSSFLVFDEFHLFPVDENGEGALATTLQMLRMLKDIAPFVLMTATFSTTMLKRLCTELDAVPVTLTATEVAALPSQRGKQRRYRYQQQQLTAEAVAADFMHEGRQRAIAVCNTVGRAQQLALALRADPRLSGVRVELLHSRFYASDRIVKEEAICREFGEDRGQYQWGPTILVATQVIEVGLNITCEVLHTELAPAAAIVQRAGRCARFAGESGAVLIYDVPEKDGRPDYAPYLDRRVKSKDEVVEVEGQSRLCERTQEAVLPLSGKGKVLAYHDELALVNEAHEPFDLQLLDILQTNQYQLREAVGSVLHGRDRSAVRTLIRDIDNRTVIVHDNPTPETIPNPYYYEGIGLRRNALLAWYSRVQPQALELELDWIVQVPVVQEMSVEEIGDARGEGAEQRRRIETQWHPCRPTTDSTTLRGDLQSIASSGLVVINPALVSYDADFGFRFVTNVPAPAPTPTSPRAPRRQDDRSFSPLQRETYAEHITGLQRVYERGLRDHTAAVRRRLEHRHRLPSGTLDRAIRLMFAAHDLGKLDKVWQEWAHRWQERVSELRNDGSLCIAANYMAAHTDFNGDDRRERKANREIQPPRPPHAAESARAGISLIDAVAGACDELYTGMMSAIICHHSANLDRSGHGAWRPAGAARVAFNQALHSVGLSNDRRFLVTLRTVNQPIDWQRGFSSAESLSEAIIDTGRPSDVIFYLLLVRVLRLADQGSQEHGRSESPRQDCSAG